MVSFNMGRRYHKCQTRIYWVVVAPSGKWLWNKRVDENHGIETRRRRCGGLSVCCHANELL